jgi:hypothetical protein
MCITVKLCGINTNRLADRGTYCLKVLIADLGAAPIVLKSSVFNQVCRRQVGLQLLHGADALAHREKGV